MRAMRRIVRPEEKRGYADDGERDDALEDFLILHNPVLLRRLRKARQE